MMTYYLLIEFNSASLDDNSSWKQQQNLIQKIY